MNKKKKKFFLPQKWIKVVCIAVNTCSIDIFWQGNVCIGYFWAHFNYHVEICARRNVSFKNNYTLQFWNNFVNFIGKYLWKLGNWKKIHLVFEKSRWIFIKQPISQIKNYPTDAVMSSCVLSTRYMQLRKSLWSNTNENT